MVEFKNTITNIEAVIAYFVDVSNPGKRSQVSQTLQKLPQRHAAYY